MPKQAQSPYVLIRSIVDSTLTIPLVKFHSSDSEPYASPGLSVCERRNLVICEPRDLVWQSPA